MGSKWEIRLGGWLCIVKQPGGPKAFPPHHVVAVTEAEGAEQVVLLAGAELVPRTVRLVDFTLADLVEMFEAARRVQDEDAATRQVAIGQQMRRAAERGAVRSPSMRVEPGAGH